MAVHPGQRQLCLSDLLRGLLHVLVLAATLQCGDAGAAKLKNVVIPKHCEEGINFVRLAGQLKDHAVGRQVDDLGLVNAGNLPQGGAGPLRRNSGNFLWFFLLLAKERTPLGRMPFIL